MKCAVCPVEGPTCTGLAVPRLCVLAETRADYRRRLRELAGELAPIPAPTPSELALVATCLYRGCPGECLQSTCHAGKSRRPGNEVDVYECLACQGFSRQG